MAESRHALAFADLEHEVDLAELPITGAFPPWLSGTLLRVGAARWRVGHVQLKHWFDGYAMLHRFAFSDGSVAYRNRMLDSAAWRSAKRGRQGFREFASDPWRPWFMRLWQFLRPRFTDNAGVNLLAFAGRHIAVTETPAAVQFDPRTLAGIGPYRFAGRDAREKDNAHPLTDPIDGATWHLTTRLGKQCSYRLFRHAPGAEQGRVVAEILVEQPMHIHSFAISERRVVIAEFPYGAPALAMAFDPRTLHRTYRWQPGRGTRWHVVDKASGVVTRIDGPAFYALHHVNAWDDGDATICDLAACADADVIDQFYLDRLRDPATRYRLPVLQRHRIDARRGTVERVALPETPFEFPRVAPSRQGLRHGVAWGVAADGAGGFIDRIVALAGDGSVRATWRVDGCVPAEPHPVPRPGATDEDDAVLLSLVLDTAAGRSFLLALDARDCRELGRAHLPHHVPLGLHGEFFPG